MYHQIRNSVKEPVVFIDDIEDDDTLPNLNVITAYFGGKEVTVYYGVREYHLHTKGESCGSRCKTRFFLVFNDRLSGLSAEQEKQLTDIRIALFVMIVQFISQYMTQKTNVRILTNIKRPERKILEKVLGSLLFNFVSVGDKERSGRKAEMQRDLPDSIYKNELNITDSNVTAPMAEFFLQRRKEPGSVTILDIPDDDQTIENLPPGRMVFSTYSPKGDITDKITGDRLLKKNAARDVTGKVFQRIGMVPRNVGVTGNVTKMRHDAASQMKANTVAPAGF